MTAEELMKPRFECIAAFPYCHEDFNITIGSIITLENQDTEQWYNLYKNKRFYDAYYESYPHLFRKLNWWEYRKVEDMPKKLIHKSPYSGVTIHFIEEWDMQNLFGYTDKANKDACRLLFYYPEYGYFPID